LGIEQRIRRYALIRAELSLSREQLQQNFFWLLVGRLGFGARWISCRVMLQSELAGLMPLGRKKECSLSDIFTESSSAVKLNWSMAC